MEFVYCMRCASQILVSIWVFLLTLFPSWPLNARIDNLVLFAVLQFSFFSVSAFLWYIVSDLLMRLRYFILPSTPPRGPFMTVFFFLSPLRLRTFVVLEQYFLRHLMTGYLSVLTSIPATLLMPSLMSVEKLSWSSPSVSIYQLSGLLCLASFFKF